MKAKRGNTKRRIVEILNCSIVIGAIFIFAKFAKAAEPAGLVINEICPFSDPYCEGGEWIEIFNPTGAVVDLENYSIEDGTKSAVKLNGLGSINPGQFIVLQKGADFSFALNDDGDSVTLKNGSDVIDSVTYGKNAGDAPVPSKGKTISRYPNGSDTNIDSDFIVMSSTKGSENVKPLYSENIIINEILPTPNNGTENEFIELYNSGDIPVDLSNWQVDDGEGGSNPYTILAGTIIGPKSYLAFYNIETKIALNDSGDSARLIDPNRDIKKFIPYHTGVKGESHSKIGDNWFWSLKLTPGAENILEQKLSFEKGGGICSIAEARNLENGQMVTIEGTVSAVPGILSANFFYIEDSTGGMQIYNYHKDFPTLHKGDRVRVAGELSETTGERRIKIGNQYDIIILSSGANVEHKDVQISEIGENLEGQYVRIKGKISQTSGNTFTIEDGGAQIKVIIKSNTKIKKPKMRKGDIVEISGIVSQYKNEYRILPIKQEDVKIISSGRLPKAGCSLLVYPFAAIFIIFVNLRNRFVRLLWNIFQKVKRKLFQSPRKLPVRQNRETFLL